MSRGAKNQPKKKHWGRGTECNIVFFEEDKHRAASEANGKGFFGGKAGETWQSHHLICISSCAVRKAANHDTTQQMEKSLYITVWNINEEPNMLGMPQKLQYMQAYGAIEKAAAKAKLSPAKQTAAWKAAIPEDIPAHNVDHNTKGGYTSEVTDYLTTNIWNKFKPKGGDHKMDAAWLANELKEASKEMQRVLLEDHGTRQGGTVPAWRTRFDNKDTWAEPFSMATTPNKRKPGTSPLTLGDIFSRL